MHHARASNAFKYLLDTLAVAKPNHHGVHRAGIQPVGTVEKQVAGDAIELAQNQADVLGTFRHFHFQGLFDRPHVDPFIVEVGHIIEAVKQRCYLLKILAFCQPLGAAMQVSDMRVHVNDALAVERENHAENTVRGGMLRPHVDTQLRLFRDGVTHDVDRQSGISRHRRSPAPESHSSCGPGTPQTLHTR